MSQHKPIKYHNKALALALLAVAPVIGHAAAYNNVGAWFKTQYYKLQFTTASQSIYAENCSGVLNVQAKRPTGAVYNVPSNLTVNLSGSAGVTFYTDSACTNAVNLVTIPSGSNSVNFYFIDTSTGSPTLTASATAQYISVSQTETISTNPYIWTGAGADTLWSTAGNWSGGAAPGSSNVTLFKGSACTTNCSPTISSSINIGGIRLNSDYAGTITQSTGSSITVGVGGWVQLAGTFVGSSSGDAFSVGDSNLVINSGSFTSTSGTLTFGSGVLYSPLVLTIGSGATFNHNGGTFYLHGPAATHTVSTGSAVFNNFKLDGTGPTVNFAGTVTVLGNLDLTSPSYNAYINSGTLAVGGNVTSTGSGGFHGSAVVKLTGNGSGQTVSTPSGGYLPNLTIETGTNPVTFGSTVSVVGNYTVNSMGTLTSTGSTLSLGPQFGANYSIKTGSENYSNVSIMGNGATVSMGGSTMNMTGSLTLNSGSGTSFINSGTLMVGGDLSATGTGSFPGSAVIQLTGNASGQTISTSGGGGLPNVTINAGTNTVTLGSTVFVRGSFIVSSAGTLVTTGSTLTFGGTAGSTNTITPGNWTYNNVSFGGNSATSNLGGATMTIAGNLTFIVTSSASPINSGTLAVSGNITGVTGSYTGGSVAIRLEGTGDQTVSSTATYLPTGSVTINKASGNVIFGSNFSQLGSWTLTAGTIYMSGYNLSTNGFSLNGNTIHRKDTGATTADGVLTVSGTTYGNGSALGGTVAD